MQQICEEHLPQEQQKSTKSAKQQLPKPVESMVLGSSIVKHVRGGIINKYSGKYSKICCYPGAGSEKVTDHAEVELKYALPETTIIHCGGNDLANDMPINEITNNIEYLGKELKHRGVKRIAVSGMVPRIYMQKDIPSLNLAFKKMCSQNGYDFIDNSNISYHWHLSDDCIHLNYDGVKLLERNFANYLKKNTRGMDKE